MSTFLNTFVDNPIIVKHQRSRLRTSQIVPGTIVVLCICGIATYTGRALGGLLGGGVFYGLSSLASLILMVGGANQVAMTVGAAKESGILDFHRVSPLPASTVSLGFFFGAPIREYLFVAVIFPFLLIAAALGGVGVMACFNTIIPLFLTAWLVHSVALLTALLAKKPRMASVGVVSLTIVTAWIGTGVLGAMADNARQNNQAFDLSTLDFFGVPIPRMLFLTIYEGAATIFFLIAATRKMAADRAYSFAKWEALVCMATMIALALGAFWNARGLPFIVVGMLYFFLVAGIVLCNTITPNLGDYLKGVRRARRLGHRRAPIFSDSASNMWAVFGIAAWVLVGATIAWEAIENQVPANGNAIIQGFVPNGRLIYSQTIAVGVLTVAYYGFSKQYFALKFGRRGETFFRLFLFLIWVMPLLVGWALAISGVEPRIMLMTLAVTPWAGLILSVNGGPAVNLDAASTIRFMALLPSVGFAIGFQFLLLMEQRRIDLDLTNSPQRPSEKILVVI